MPEKVLDCGYVIYNICIKIYRRQLSLTKYSYYLLFYILYASPYRAASIYILSIDGGGIRGVISLIFLIYIKQALSNFRYSLREHFDLIYGTSAGGMTTIGIGLLGWSAADKTFKRRKFRSTLLTSLTAIESGFKAAFRSHLKMFNPLINNTRVIPYLFCNYNRGKRPKEIRYSLIRANYSYLFLWPKKGKPNFALSLGTNRFYLRLFKSFMRKEYRSRYHRFNLYLQGPKPPLNNLSMVGELKS
ncbi:patatin [Cenococcum geophilum]